MMSLSFPPDCRQFNSDLDPDLRFSSCRKFQERGDTTNLLQYLELNNAHFHPLSTPMLQHVVSYSFSSRNASEYGVVVCQESQRKPVLTKRSGVARFLIIGETLAENVSWRPGLEPKSYLENQVLNPFVVSCLCWYAIGRYWCVRSG